MNIFYVLLPLVISLSFPSIGEACQVTNPSSMVSEYSNQGIKTSMIFASHNTYGIDERLNEIHAQNSSPQAQAAGVRSLLADHSALAREQAAKYDHIRNQVEAGNVNWIGVELSVENIKNFDFENFTLYERYEQNIRQKFGSVLSEQEIDNLLYISLPTAYIYLARNRHQLNKIKVVSLEDTALNQRAHTNHFAEEAAISNVFANLDSASDADKQAALRALSEILGNDRRTVDMFNRNQVTGIAESISNENLRRNVLEYTDLSANFVSIQRERDEVAARIIHQQNQNGPGLAIYGSDHGPGIQRHLMDICSGRAPAPRSGQGPANTIE